MSEPDDLRRREKHRRLARVQDRGAQRERRLGELRRVRPVARSVLIRGTVVWARIPYVEDPEVSKSRPAVVAEVAGRTIRLLPVTSSMKESVRQSALYVELREWAAAGLTRPCLVTRRLVTVDIIDVSAVVGQLSAPDASRVFISPLGAAVAGVPKAPPGIGEEQGSFRIWE